MRSPFRGRPRIGSKRSRVDPLSGHPQKAWRLGTILAHLWDYIKPHSKRFSWGLLCILATNAIAVLAPWVLKYAIQDLQAGVTSQKIYTYALLLVLIALVAGVFRYLMRRIIISISRYIEYDMRTKFFAHLEKLSPSFYDYQATGDLMTRASSDIEAVRMVVGPAVMYSVDTLLTAAFALSLMFVLSVKLTLSILALAPLLSLMIYFLAKQIHRFSLLSQERYSDLNAMIQEHLSGVRVVRAYCQEESERELFKNLNQRYISASMSLVKLQAALVPFFYSAFGLGMAVVLYSGGAAIITGAMTLGDFVAFSAYVAMLAWPVIAAGWVINLYQRGAASLQRIHKILEISPDIADGSNVSRVQSLHGHIQFHQVSVKYSAAASAALSEISLDIPAGSSLGIVGSVGSGKSSLVNLIPRLYEASSGAVEIDGMNVKEIPLNILRRDVAIVPQESFLFSDRMDRNILFADLKSSEESLREAVRLAALERDLEEFPEGLKTWVGERGITLSGGQKQRASLARALAANPRILILDDCFSAVDTQTESEILARLRPMLRTKTVLIVAHRISTLQWADQIIFLEGGRILEKGCHEELIRLGGRYADFFRKQLLEEELRAAG